MTLGAGIAIAAIWCAVTAMAWRDPAFAAVAFMPAVGATFLVCLFQ